MYRYVNCAEFLERAELKVYTIGNICLYKRVIP